MGARILLVEDEPQMADVVERYLTRDGHSVKAVADGLEALPAFEALDPQLVILDIMLPGMDGLEICRRLRAISDVPVIMLTARSEEMDRLLGFGLGADDYVTKPFSPRELAARVQAVLRRSAEPDRVGRDLLRFGDLTINRRSRRVENASGEIAMTAKEFDLLAFLAAHPGQVFTRDQLIDAVWDQMAVIDENAVTVHVRRIRAKLEPDPSRPRYIRTVWGVGYKFDP